MWRSCAAALDGCIYFMPSYANRMKKLDASNNDEISSVGDDLEMGDSSTLERLSGLTVPANLNLIIKYDPINDTTSIVGEKLMSGSIVQWEEMAAFIYSLTIAEY